MLRLAFSGTPADFFSETVGLTAVLRSSYRNYSGETPY